jgi:transcriptional regulator with XRE-family HTH domain
MRIARAAIDLTISDLAEQASVAPNMIGQFEGRKTAPISATVAALRAAPESAAVEFIAENSSGAGLRLKAPGT